jgi:hypothetical protein
MKVTVAFVLLEVLLEVVLAWDLPASLPDPCDRPSANVVKLRSCEPERIQTIRHLPVVLDGSPVGTSDGLIVIKTNLYR